MDDFSKETDSQPLVHQLLQARQTLQPIIVSQPEADVQSRETAYTIQSGVMARLGANGGFKTARPDPALPNIMAPIPASKVRPSPARYGKDEMRLVGIELEIAFRIERDLPAIGTPNYERRLRSAVSVLPVIEMVDSRVADHVAAPDLLKLADNQNGFGLVTGSPVPEFEQLNLKNPPITFTVNGRQIGATTGKVPGEVDAFHVLKDFLEVVGDHCGGVQPGMFVTTGSLSGLHWAAHGDTIAGQIEGLGEVSVVVEA